MIMIKRVPGRKIPEPETLRNGQEQKDQKQDVEKQKKAGGSYSGQDT